MTSSEPTGASGTRRPTVRRAADPTDTTSTEEFGPCGHCGGTGRAPRPAVPAVVAAPPLVVVAPVVTDAERVAVARMMAAVCEVLDGRRPVAQLRAEAPVLRYLSAARSTRPRTAGATRVLTVRASRPAREALEVAAVLRVDGRPRAVAARLDGPADRWMLSAVRIL